MQNILYDGSEKRVLWQKTIVLFIMFMMQVLIITMFSSQPSEQSAEISNSIMDKIEQLPQSIPETVTIGKERITVHRIVRKLAHVYNFSIIGILLAAIHLNLKEDYRKVILWAAVGLLIAILDETHQHFVSGRSGEVIDVLIDFSGVLFGASFIKVFLGIILAKRCKK